jgi:hypothetical protein
MPAPGHAFMTEGRGPHGSQSLHPTRTGGKRSFGNCLEMKRFSGLARKRVARSREI